MKIVAIGKLNTYQRILRKKRNFLKASEWKNYFLLIHWFKDKIRMNYLQKLQREKNVMTQKKSRRTNEWFEYLITFFCESRPECSHTFNRLKNFSLSNWVFCVKRFKNFFVTLLGITKGLENVQQALMKIRESFWND